jgi:hypothetical protein
VLGFGVLRHRPRKTALKAPHTEAASSSTAPKTVTFAGCRREAFLIKEASKQPVVHAFLMYGDLENRARQHVIATVAQPLHEWYMHQSVELRDVVRSRKWTMEQCAGAYVRHVVETLGVVHGTGHLSKCGLDTDFSQLAVHTVDDAFCAGNDVFAGYIGMMALALAGSRLRWGCDFLQGWPRRQCLLCADAPGSPQEFVTELRRQVELLDQAVASDSAILKMWAARNHLRLPPAVQLIAMLKAATWVVTPDIVDFVTRASSRISASQALEDGFNRQKAKVKRSATARIGHEQCISR